MFKQYFWGVVAVLLVTSATAFADPINGVSSGITDAGTTLTFDEVALDINEVVTTQYSLFGVTFSPNLYFTPQSGFPNTDPGNLGNFTFAGQSAVTPYSILFDSDQDMASFSMAWNAGDATTFTALNDGQVVESFSATSTSNNANNFFGFENIVFDEIQVDVGGGGNFMLMDNLSFTSAVTPESDALLFLMLPTAGGTITEDSLISWTTLSNTYSGVLTEGAFRIPEFEANFSKTQVQNGVTQIGLFGGGDIPGGSSHLYSNNNEPIAPDVQDAIVFGLDAINANDPAWEQLLIGNGVDPALLNEPGATIEGIPGGVLVDWFTSFYFGPRPVEEVRPEIAGAIFTGTFDVVEASQTSELEIFPHDDTFGSIGNIVVVLNENPEFFDDLTTIQQITSAGVTNNQDFIPPNPIPEPSTVVLMGLALVGGAVLMRRRRAA